MAFHKATGAKPKTKSEHIFLSETGEFVKCSILDRESWIVNLGTCENMHGYNGICIMYYGYKTRWARGTKEAKVSKVANVAKELKERIMNQEYKISVGAVREPPKDSLIRNTRSFKVWCLHTNMLKCCRNYLCDD